MEITYWSVNLTQERIKEQQISEIIQVFNKYFYPQTKLVQKQCSSRHFEQQIQDSWFSGPMLFENKLFSFLSGNWVDNM